MDDDKWPWQEPDYKYYREPPSEEPEKTGCATQLVMVVVLIYLVVSCSSM